MNDETVMKKALDLAGKGVGFTSPNPMVGAVLVKDGKVVGTGYHQAAGKAHAEVNAIDAAGPLAKGALLYVTLEPCNHVGRTPPCTEKILAAGISEVVVAMLDPNLNVTGGGVDYLQQRGIPVRTGVCEAEARKLNEYFIKYVTTRRPFVTVKCAATLDGRIATRTGDSKWVTGPESRAFVHRLRHAVDAIMVGIHTVQKDDPTLTTRIDGKGGKDPIRVILDTRLSISEDAKVLRPQSDSATILVSAAPVTDAQKKKKDRLEKKGVRIVAAPLKGGRIDLDPLMDRLGGDGITSLLIEGGAEVIASALADGIVDKVFFFYAPKILGGDDGVPICRGTGPELMEGCIRVRDMDVRRFGSDVLLEGYIAK
ncbi:MAG: bifunctional diaminohydroxyphosphoribosylaminopyrimidine deaminase/5-amino-6-(5-phosphoribosylamino)uracil reductase RibD [Desulfobacterales bacterium]|nr:bifunctional diaminohydroxyphosphoribosylaminopyrimidine deaminase/5-amino-6-(5-phosphoribosylamino)uracil reductase RibD [Desulfobacterales bacterium]